MISFLRERLQGIVAFSFLGIVALTFAFLGLPTFAQTFNNNDYAQIGNYSISQSEYFRTKSQVEQNLRSQFGDGLNFSDPAIVDIVSNLTNNSIIEKYTLINLVDDLEIKILELREITGWKIPIYLKIGGTRPYFDTTLAVKAGADVVVLDGMQGGTAATQDVFIENVGLPTIACIRPAVQALQDLGVHREVQLIISGGIRTGADVAKAMAMGADAVAIGSAALIALGDNDPKWETEYQKLGTTSGAYDDWHEGLDPAGITTQDPELMARFDPIEGGRRLKNYLKVLTLEAQTIARACGKNHLHNLEPEDLCALTLEAAAMTGIPLAGTNWYPGKGY